MFVWCNFEIPKMVALSELKEYFKLGSIRLGLPHSFSVEWKSFKTNLKAMVMFME
jgi:hypothetical protein